MCFGLLRRCDVFCATFTSLTRCLGRRTGGAGREEHSRCRLRRFVLHLSSQPFVMGMCFYRIHDTSSGQLSAFVCVFVGCFIIISFLLLIILVAGAPVSHYVVAWMSTAPVTLQRTDLFPQPSGNATLVRFRYILSKNKRSHCKCVQCVVIFIVGLARSQAVRQHIPAPTGAGAQMAGCVVVYVRIQHLVPLSVFRATHCTFTLPCLTLMNTYYWDRCVDGQPAARGCIDVLEPGAMPVIDAVGGNITDFSFSVIYEPFANGAYFLGELQKFVHVSPQRFASIVVDAGVSRLLLHDRAARMYSLVQFLQYEYMADVFSFLCVCHRCRHHAGVFFLQRRRVTKRAQCLVDSTSRFSVLRRN